MKILIMAADPRTIFWHRYDLVVDFINHGFDVVVAASGDDKEWGVKLLNIGVKFRHIDIERTGLNPLRDLHTMREYVKVIKEENPDKILVYQAKAISYGCWAAHRCGFSEVYTMLTGLGSIFRANTLKSHIVKLGMSFLYKRAFKFSKNVIFQNEDDYKTILDSKLVTKDKCYVVNGSGVNIVAFQYKDVPSEPALLYVGRIVRDKGVIEYLEACVEIKKLFPNVRCMLVGPFDTNPSSLNDSDLKPYLEAGVEYFGQQDDVKPFFETCSTYVLPSYHEGTPRSVLQAMAIGRAIITTDAPGCRDTVQDGVNGFLVPVRNVTALIDKMKQLIENPILNAEMGRRSRIIAENKYDVTKVNHEIFKIMDIVDN